MREGEKKTEKRREMGSIAVPKRSLSASVSGQVRSSLFKSRMCVRTYTRISRVGNVGIKCTVVTRN